MHAHRWLTPVLILAGASGAMAQSHGPRADPGAWHVVREVGPILPASPTAVDILAVIEAELVLGRADRAVELVSRHLSELDTTQVSTLRVLASLDLALDRDASAGQRLARAAMSLEGVERGILQARAADAYGRAGFERLARTHYRSAAKALRPIKSWLAIREARIAEDAAMAFKLLRGATLPARRLAALARRRRSAA